MNRLLLLSVALSAPTVSVPAHGAESGKRYEIRFPADLVRPSEGLAIDRLRIVVACGEFVAIERVPPDWNVGISRPISAQAGFDASAGHGISALRDLSAFDGRIVIGRADPECLGVSSATAASAQGEWEREIVGLLIVERAASR